MVLSRLAVAKHSATTSGVHGRTGAVVGATDTQTLSGKTLTAPTITAPTISGDSPTAPYVQAREVIFVEEGEGAYTGEIAIPAGAMLVDVLVYATALWDAATSASLEVGDDDDPDGFYTAVDLKATDLTAGQSLSFAQSGGVGGAYLVGSSTHWTNRYKATARTLTATVVSVGAGTAGRTRVVAIYTKPAAADVVTATFAA